MEPDITKYKKNLIKPLRKVSLCLLLQDDEILLAMKLRGFGAGNWNGYGGKIIPGETIKQAAIREVFEESGMKLSPKNLKKVGSIDFYFRNIPQEKDWNQRMVVYLVKRWRKSSKNTPKRTEEMDPKWFKLKDIPYDSMWEPDRFWLPYVLEGKIVKAAFLFNVDEINGQKHAKVIEHNIETQ